MTTDMGDRKSEAEIPPLIVDPTELAQREASNALAQFDWAMQEADRWIKAGGPNLKVSVLLKLHRLAMDGIDQYAGNFRPASVAIRGSKHIPVAGEDVPRYVEEMLEYIDDNWNEKTAIHLSSYVMWRLNWIHPFADGNGRTSRILSYMVLCGKLGQILPGSRTIPEQISENKGLYYEALEKAEVSFKKGSVNVVGMEGLMEGYLANQLVQIHTKATGGTSVRDGKIAQLPTNKWRLRIDSMEARPVLIGTLVTVILAALALYFG